MGYKMYLTATAIEHFCGINLVEFTFGKHKILDDNCKLSW